MRPLTAALPHQRAIRREQSGRFLIPTLLDSAGTVSMTDRKLEDSSEEMT